MISVRYSQETLPHVPEQDNLNEFRRHACYSDVLDRGYTCVQTLVSKDIAIEIAQDMCLWVTKFGLPVYLTKQGEFRYSLDVFYTMDTKQDLLYFVLCQCRFLTNDFCDFCPHDCAKYAEYLEKYAHMDNRGMLHTPCIIGDIFEPRTDAWYVVTLKEMYDYWNTGLIFSGPSIGQTEKFSSTITISKIRESQQP